jgi:tetratricopeptide (TPR) repeat protein
LVDVFEVQDEIAARIESALKVHLGSGSSTRVAGTTDAQAYDAYLRGRQGLHQRTRTSIQSARRFLEIATAKDPEFALAWAALAQTHILLSETQYGTIKRKDAHTSAQVFIDRAMALDAELAEAHAMQGYLYKGYREAVTSFDQAIAYNPGVGEFYLWRSTLEWAFGKYKESQEDLQHALYLDPLHPAILGTRAGKACEFGLEPVTEDLLLRLERYPGRAAHVRTNCLITRGHYAEAYQLISQTADSNAGLLRDLSAYFMKDCEIAWNERRLTLDEDLIFQSLYCEGLDAALETYQAMSLDEQQSKEAVKLFSLLQLRRGDYSGMLKTLEPLNPDQDPAENLDLGVFDVNNLAINRSFALLQLGKEPEARQLLDGVRKVIDRARQEGVKRNLHVLEAKLLLLEADQQGAVDSLNAAIEGFEIEWLHLADPVFHELLEPDKLSEITASLDQHINAERAKLGWPPADF